MWAAASPGSRKVGMDLGFSQSQSDRVCLWISGPFCPLNFVEVNPVTLTVDSFTPLVRQDTLSPVICYYPSQNLNLPLQYKLFTHHALLGIFLKVKTGLFYRQDMLVQCRVWNTIVVILPWAQMTSLHLNDSIQVRIPLSKWSPEQVWIWSKSLISLRKCG